MASKARTVAGGLLTALLALVALAGRAQEPGATESAGEALVSGAAIERSIAVGERHTYRAQVGDRPWLLRVEQRGVNLVVEVAGPEGRAVSDGGDRRWGPEIALLTSPGDYRIEVRVRDPAVPPGRYGLVAETLALPLGDDATALAATSQANQLGADRTPAGRQRSQGSWAGALARWRALEEPRWQAECLDHLGDLAADGSDFRTAIASYTEALALWRRAGDLQREAATANELGITYLYTGESALAREALTRSLTLWRGLGERLQEGLAGSSLCFLDHTGGSLAAALTCYQEKLALFHELGDLGQEARLLNLIGGVYSPMGEPDAALDHYRQALAIYERLDDPLDEAQVLNNLAVVHRGLGEWQEALRLYDQTRKLLAFLGNRRQEAALLSNLGFAYVNLGEPERGLTSLEAALELRREIDDRSGQITTLNQLGETWRQLGDVQQALAEHRQALELATALGDRRQEALTRLRLAETLLEQDDPAAALRELEPALAAFQEMGVAPRAAQALELRGRALVRSGRAREALPILTDALARRREQHDRAGEAAALQALATAERAASLAAEAMAHAEQAVARVEELRQGFVSPDLRAAFLATQRRVYSLRIDLLMDRHAAEPWAGHDREALAVSEQARARSLLDVLETGTAVPTGSAVPAALLEQRRSLRRRLSFKADQQLRQNDPKAAGALGPEMEALRNELDGLEAEMRRLDPRYAAAVAPRALTVEGIARLLDPETLLVEYSLGAEHSYLWAVGAGSCRSFVLPPEREIEALVRPLYEQLSILEAGARPPAATAEALSRILLGPLWPAAAQYQRLVVVPDGVLHLLPFGALPVPTSPASPGGGPLLAELEIAYLPSATTLALERQRLLNRPPAPRRAAILADPVFSADDPRLASAGGGPPAKSGDPVRGGAAGGPRPGFERLPSSRGEAKAIAGLAPPGEVWMALDLAASRETALSGKLGDYRCVHFATHGLVDLRAPELSGLVLSQVDASGQPREGLLTVADLYDLELRADLVVLSGCRTALGKEVRGEGLMGLTRGFLYAGVPRVVASLWQVQDRATAELMTRFYRALWQDGLPPAAALRAAQRALARDPRYRAPYFWAGFVLQGDWR